MEEKKADYIHPETERFIRAFLKSQSAVGNFQSGNDRMIGSAFVYEKIRTSLEYAEDHLVFKNAIARILRRKITLNLNPKAHDLVVDLVSELSWANYINPEGVSKEQSDKIESTINRYLVFLRSARSGVQTKNQLQKMIIAWMASEIDEIFNPSTDRDLYINYVATILEKNIALETGQTFSEEARIQLKIAIFNCIFKPDYYLLQFWLLRQAYSDWSTMPEADFVKIAKSFDPYYNKVDRLLNFPERKKYWQFVKINIAPFILFYRVLSTEKIEIEKLKEKPEFLHRRIMDVYEQAVNETKKKVWRGTYRALIFIFITKISLAFLVEIPFDRLLAGSVNYLTLLINVLLPPFLMLAAGTFVKSPSVKNSVIVSAATKNLIYKNYITEKRFPLFKSRGSRTNQIFNLAYFVFTFLVLVGTTSLLIWLGFNIVSIILFFLFVSAVSFFSFRIRSMALELAMKRTRDDALTSTLEFVFLPFIRIGRYLSDRIAAFNPVVLALDFLIEAPLKSIIKITNLWFKFINAKKEDLEL